MRYESVLWMLPVLLAVSSAHGQGTDMSVEEAYRAIPHQRTVFDAGAATMEESEREYLVRALDLIDRAIVERVEMLTWITTNRTEGRAAKYYAGILQEFEALKVPTRLKAAHRLIGEAIREQRQVLEDAAADTRFQATGILVHPAVKSASAKLIEAYGLLIAAYPQEGAHNKQAFFDYLCALDFI